MADRPWEEPFIAGVEAHGRRSRAADEAGVSLRTVQYHEAIDPELRVRTSEAYKRWLAAEKERRTRKVVNALDQAEEICPCCGGPIIS